MPRLVAQSTEFEGQIFELSTPEVTVGRQPENVLPIDHGSVSGRHALLTLVDGDYIIKDLNSTNGTRVNGTKVMQHRLSRGDTLHIGNLQFRYDSEVGGEMQPLPEVSLGIELNTSGQSIRPGDFVNASPFTKNKKDPIAKVAGVLTIVLAVAAVGGIGFLFSKLLSA